MGPCCSKKNDADRPHKSGGGGGAAAAGTGGWPKEKNVAVDPQYKWSYEYKPHPPRQAKSAQGVIKDPAHYQAKNLKGETWIRAPGTINRQQIQVDNCEDCDFYLCDCLDSLIVDDCKNCRFFVGPTASSAFIRTSSNCKFVMACGQFRLRECRECDFLLFCHSQPVVESSKKIRLGCFRGYYFNLKEQFDTVRLSVFNNRWSEIHDFTPSADSYSYLDPAVGFTDMLKPFSEVVPEVVTAQEESNPVTVVPNTWGDRDLPKAGEFGFALFLPGQNEACQTFLSAVVDKHKELILSRTKEAVLRVKDASQIFSQTALTKATKELILKGPVIGIGLFGNQATAAATELLTGVTGVVVATSAAEAKHCHQQFFGEHKLDLV